MYLSIIIACFNSEATIDIQLSALTQQTWNHPWEILIADNGCTDKTLEIVEKYQTHCSHLRIIDASGKKGSGYARNVAVREARGEVILFCDSDDKVHEGWVEAMGNALKDADFVAGALSLKELNEAWRIPDNHPFGTATYPQQKLPRYRHAPDLQYAAAANLGIKKSVHLAIGGFDENLLYNQDLDYCLRVQLAGYPLHFVPNALVEYRLKHNLKKSYQQFYRWGRYGLLVYRKNIGKGSTIDKLRFIFGGWRHLPAQLIKVRRRADLFELFAWIGGRMGEIHGCWEFLIMQSDQKQVKHVHSVLNPD